jgi:hypothetical protein
MYPECASMKRKGKLLSVPSPFSQHTPCFIAWPLFWLWSLPNNPPSTLRSETPLPNCSTDCSQSVSNRLTLFLVRVTLLLCRWMRHSSETSVYNKPTRHSIPENDIQHCICVALSSPQYWDVWVNGVRLCGLVVRVSGFRSRGPGSIPGATRFSEK